MAKTLYLVTITLETVIEFLHNVREEHALIRDLVMHVIYSMVKNVFVMHLSLPTIAS